MKTIKKEILFNISFNNIKEIFKEIVVKNKDYIYF